MLAAWSAPGTRATRDLLAASALGLLAGVLLVSVNASERYLAFAERHERWQVDEIPLLLLLSCVILAWLAGRRWQDARREVAARIQTEQRVRELLQENQHLLSHALALQEEERRSLARELHDELGQYLHAARAEAVALKLASGDPMIAERAAAIEHSLAHIAQAARAQIGRLRPPALDELGLAAALESLAERQFAPVAGLQWECHVDAAVDVLPPGLAINLYRIAQECLTNVVRHACASRVTLEMRAVPGGWLLQIADDGRGFDSVSAPGYGLPGIRERVEAMHGRLEILSGVGRGVRVRVMVPAAEAAP